MREEPDENKKSNQNQIKIKSKSNLYIINDCHILYKNYIFKNPYPPTKPYSFTPVYHSGGVL
uniref:Uncharacterized protein n=1 Tax=viral metagenome TaxID=1070528 RepID=A0A6C0CWJ4_9ZZZZ